MTDPVRAIDRLRAMSGTARLLQAAAVITALGIPDLLSDGARSADELAAATGSHGPSLYRVLRAVAAGGFLHEGVDGRFSLTDLGAILRSDAPDSQRDWLLYITAGWMREAWGNLGQSVRTGENAFEALHGESVWQWRSHRPSENEIFNRGMASMSAPVGPAVAAAYDFSSLGTLVDVGGGTGTLLAAILARHHRLRGILFDLPHVVSQPETPSLLEGVGVNDRCEIVGGSFFDGVPQGADAYILKSILHDWDDDRATAILRTVRAAATARSVLLLVERVVGSPNTDLDTKLSDLHMLVLPGGRERTEGEWRRVIEDAGFGLDEIRPVIGPFRLLVGTPRPEELDISASE